MELAHAKTCDETVRFFGTDPDRGLSEDQVRKAQEKYGPNGKKKRRNFRRTRFVKLYRNFLRF